jgi:acyl-CoA reductase-like NAD-dependent aldehyde dehydrogenase
MAAAAEENQETLATLEMLNTGKTITEAMCDIGLIVDHLTYACSACGLLYATAAIQTHLSGRLRSDYIYPLYNSR